MKLAVYVPAGPNPIFLRLFLLQLARQTRQPDVICIYENGCSTSALEFVGKDILKEFTGRLIHKHEALPANRVKRYYEPLHMAYHHPAGINTFLKMDLDDFYFDNYIKEMESYLGGHDWAANLNNGLLLVRPQKGDFKMKKSAVMRHNPVGCAALAVFNRRFAQDYLGALLSKLNCDAIADDDIMAEVMKDKRTHHEDGEVQYVYVSHGANESSWSWQNTGGKIYFDN